MSAASVPFLDLAGTLDADRPALLAAATRVIQSGSFILGREGHAFEAAFAEHCGVAHGVGVANGFDALELALRALAMGPGQRVGTVANAGGYASAAIHAVGATPVYVDVDPDRLLLDVAATRELVTTDRLDCVIATHLYGQVVDLRDLSLACRSAGIPLIEDCSQAHGGRLDGRPVGSFGDIGCFSFYPTKNLGALGDAGCCVCDRSDLAALLRQLRNYGWEERYRIGAAGGRNSRLDEIQAAFLQVRLVQLDAANAARTELAAYYRTRLRGCRSFSLLPGLAGDTAHLAVLRCTRREALIEHLYEEGIGSAIHYPIADFDQPSWQGLPAARHGDLRHTRLACQQVLSIPCNASVSAQQREQVVNALIAFENRA